MSSFQEMRANQINQYLELIAETCSGVFYSWNTDTTPQNLEMRNLSEMLKQRFELTEILPSQPRKELTVKQKIKLRLRSTLRSVAILVELWDRPRSADGV
ncbi:MAG: hypothetical protein ABSF82_07765 [Candidatus Bathyarchaeia archaeon]|jgi:hypothetical protein